MTSILEFQNVSKNYGSKRAVDNLSFSIEKGTIVALLGPNGAGKTTTMAMLLGLIQPTDGKISVLHGNPRQPATRRQIGAMLQNVSLPDKISVQELLQLFRSNYPNPASLETLLQMTGLTAERHKDASKLSGGQQRRVQFALAMAGNPQFIVLDEPTTGMDVNSRRDFWHQLREYTKNGERTLLLSTHHLEEADAIADRILVIQHGKLIADGSPAEIKAKTGWSYIRMQIGEGFTAADLQCFLTSEDECSMEGRKVQIRTRDSDSLLRKLLRTELPLSQIEVSQGKLEDAFFAITNKENYEEVTVS
ncbi:ABC transporter ATP-binding protein [Alicyclobacillus tolerans]|uniref:ABC transporter ATP-binding protein n=1 Tax=Alicyclobacillus tolerans TaxID=90970 RepID=UPI003B7BC995